VPQALEYLKGFKHIITLETTEPIAFFSYPDKPSLLKAPGHQRAYTGRYQGEDSVGLEMLLDALGARDAAPVLQQRAEATPPTGALTPATIAQAAGRGAARKLHPGR
jgi:acetolactate synthase-1/2/3 large subunit